MFMYRTACLKRKGGGEGSHVRPRDSYRVCFRERERETDRHQNECSCRGFAVRGLSPGCVLSSLIDLAFQCQVLRTQWTPGFSSGHYIVTVYRAADEWAFLAEIKPCLQRLSCSHNQDSAHTQTKRHAQLVMRRWKCDGLHVNGL